MAEEVKPRPKILLTAILKDDSEAAQVERMLESFMPYFDGLCVLITGLSGEHKKLEKIIKKYKGRYAFATPTSHPDIYIRNKEGKWIFGNFAAARNACFELAAEMQKEHDYDWWSWADKDDILISGAELLNVAQMGKDQNLDSIYFVYWYSVLVDDKGTIKSVVIDHLRERLLKPGMFKWVSRLHEISLPKDQNYQLRQSMYDVNPQQGRTCVWVHLPQREDVQSNLYRNSEILEIQAKEEEHKDPRTLMYLAKTYHDLADLEKKPNYDQLAIMLFEEYLDGPYKSGWAEERSNACEYVGNIYGRMGKHQKALDWYNRGLEEFAANYILYLLKAQALAELKRFEESEFVLDMIVRKDPPSTRTTIGNPLSIQLIASGLKHNEAMRKLQIKEAIKWMRTHRKLLGFSEDDDYVKMLVEADLINESAHWVFNFAKWLKDHGHKDKIPMLLKSLPHELGQEPFAHFIANEISEPRKWGEDEIAYFASFGGNHFEQWSDKSLGRGIGGSETAVIQLARQWAKLGYKVTVFGDPRQDAGERDGVSYRPWYEMNWKDEFNILILWRSPHLLDKEIKAKKLFMDLHDVASQLDWTDARTAKVNKVFVKSQFHRAMLPKIPDEKVAIISNGITV